MTKKHRYPARTPFFVLLALFVTLMLGACETDQTEPEAVEEPPAAAEEGPLQDEEEPGATVEEIEGDPAEYIGQTVRVDGQVQDVYGQNSFTLEGDWLGGSLLVFVPPDVSTGGITFNEGDNAQVTGTVREYVVADIENEYGVDLGAEIDYEEQEPVVIADSVATGVMEEM